MKKSLLFTGSLTLLACGAQAASIGVNFIGGRGGGNDENGIVGAQSAGVVAQTNWNDVGAGSAASGGPTALTDDGGTVLATTVAWSSNNTWTINSAAPADGNAALMKGYLDTNNSAGSTTITVANIPYSNFSLYLYYDGDNGAGTRNAVYTANGGGTTPANLWDDANWDVGAAGGSHSLPDVSGRNGNYYVFTGLTNGTDLTITGDEGVFRAPINGLQIVQVPEPSSAAIFGVFGALLALRRRR